MLLHHSCIASAGPVTRTQCCQLVYLDRVQASQDSQCDAMHRCEKGTCLQSIVQDDCGPTRLFSSLGTSIVARGASLHNVRHVRIDQQAGKDVATEIQWILFCLEMLPWGHKAHIVEADILPTHDRRCCNLSTPPSPRATATSFTGEGLS